MRTLALVVALALAACNSPPAPSARSGGSGVHPDTCGNICSSNIECSTGPQPGCKYCSFGTCSSVLPTEPTTIDAGVDAAPAAAR